MWRQYKFRCYPTESQERLFLQILEDCRQLYNDALQDRRDAWRYHKKRIARFDQYYSLPEILDDDPSLRARIYRTTFDDVLDRVDRAFRAFFRRCKEGKKPGYPRFKGFGRYRSFTYKSSGFRLLSHKRIRLSKVGQVRYRPWLQDLPDKKLIKNCIVKKEADGWYVVLVCRHESESLPPAGSVVGVDVGIRNLVTLSNGGVLGDLSVLRNEDKRILLKQQELSRKKRGSKRRAKARKVLAKRHQHLRRMRKAKLDIISKKLVEENDLLVFENLDSQQLIDRATGSKKGKGLRRSMRHASWATLSWMCAYKAESAGRTYIEVDPRNTSQECSECGQIVPKTLSVRVHKCSCGCVLDRDVNAARNILKRGLQLLRSQGREDHISNSA